MYALSVGVLWGGVVLLGIVSVKVNIGLLLLSALGPAVTVMGYRVLAPLAGTSRGRTMIVLLVGTLVFCGLTVLASLGTTLIRLPVVLVLPLVFIALALGVIGVPQVEPSERGRSGVLSLPHLAGLTTSAYLAAVPLLCYLGSLLIK
jgi:hypothetical protein